jgi:hypothetical protein
LGAKLTTDIPIYLFEETLSMALEIPLRSLRFGYPNSLNPLHRLSDCCGSFLSTLPFGDAVAFVVYKFTKYIWRNAISWADSETITHELAGSADTVRKSIVLFVAVMCPSVRKPRSYSGDVRDINGVGMLVSAADGCTLHSHHVPQCLE